MKRIISIILFVLSVSCVQVLAQNTEDWGTFEFELATSHSLGTFSPGINGRLSLGYIVPSGKAGVYLDWGSGSGKMSEAAHTVLVSGGLPWYAGERFSAVPKIGLGVGLAGNETGERKYHFTAALSATLRYYISNVFYCGFDARFVGLTSSSREQDKFMYNPEVGICFGVLL